MAYTVDALNERSHVPILRVTLQLSIKNRHISNIRTNAVETFKLKLTIASCRKAGVSTKMTEEKSKMIAKEGGGFCTISESFNPLETT